MEGAAKGEVVVGDTKREADGAVCGDGLKDDRKDRVAWSKDVETVTFDNGDEPYGKDEPPEVVRELGA